MNLSSLAATAVASVAAAALTGLVAAAARSRHERGTIPESMWRCESRGCSNQDSVYPEAPIVIHGVDGTNQGLALALLRDRAIEPDADTPALDLSYDETIRSCVEVAINIALNLAEADIDTQCSCGDEDCESSDIDYGVLTLLAGKKMTEMAISFTAAANRHARSCEPCEEAGLEAPGHVRARFCRDLSDDLLTNPSSDHVQINGVPVPAALDALGLMLEVAERTHDVSVADQVVHLTLALAGAIAHKEAHEATQP